MEVGYSLLQSLFAITENKINNEKKWKKLQLKNSIMWFKLFFWILINGTRTTVESLVWSSICSRIWWFTYPFSLHEDNNYGLAHTYFIHNYLQVFSLCSAHFQLKFHDDRKNVVYNTWCFLSFVCRWNVLNGLFSICGKWNQANEISELEIRLSPSDMQVIFFSL